MTEPVTLDDPDAYFERLAEFDARHWWPRAMRTIARGQLERALRGRTGLTALDVGCGVGSTLEFLKRFDAIASVVGLEPSREALARRRDAANPAARGSALRLPFGEGRFDVLVCLDVLQHLPAGGVPTALAGFHRVLRPDGVLLARTNAGGRTGFRFEALRDKLTDAGFRVEWGSRVNCVPALAQELRGRLTRGGRPHPEGGGLPRVTPGPAGSRLMAGVSAIEAQVLARLGATLPFGHGLMFVARRPPERAG